MHPGRCPTSSDVLLARRDGVRRSRCADSAPQTLLLLRLLLPVIVPIAAAICLLWLCIVSTTTASAAESAALPSLELPPDEGEPAARNPAELIPAPPPDAAPFDYTTDPDTFEYRSDISPNSDEALPPLEEELWLHGGAHLYEAEGEGFWESECEPFEEQGGQRLRLPEDYVQPMPITAFQEFLGSDPIKTWPRLHWFGPQGFAWEPALVVYGRYNLFAFAQQAGDRHISGIGHQLLADLDLRITDTERLHVQYRPIGKKNTGGSYYQFSDPAHYVDNSTGAPDRWWIEGEFYSIFQGWLGDQFTPRDVQMVAGKFPFVLQNTLLLNDDIVGFAVNKNTIYLDGLSNMNLQAYYALDDVDAFDVAADLFGVNAFIDYHLCYIEANYARLENSRDARQDANYAALSATQFYGAYSLAGRAMFRWHDDLGRDNGELFVIESNWTREFTGRWARQLDIPQGVFYVNAFRATSGWRPISGGNFNRLRSSFEVNPLVNIARGVVDDTTGVAAGVQLFRHHQDESFTPELALQTPHGRAVWGAGLRYQRKTSERSFFEVLGLINWSNDPAFRREGIFASESIFF